MPTPPVAPGVDPAAFAAAYDTGLTITECAARFGVSFGTARNRLVAAGVVFRRHGQRPASSGPALAAAYDAGATIAECAAQFGIPFGTARNRLIAAGVVLRQRGPRQPVITRVDLGALAAGHSAGMSQHRLAAVHGTSPTTISRILASAGITHREIPADAEVPATPGPF